MTPAYQNPSHGAASSSSSTSFPLLERKEDSGLHFFMSSPTQQAAASPSLLCAAFPNRSTEDRSEGVYTTQSSASSSKVDINGGLSYARLLPSSSHQAMLIDQSESTSEGCQRLLSLPSEQIRDQEAGRDLGVKWMSSKMRFMHKMKSSTCNGPAADDDGTVQVMMDKSSVNLHRHDRIGIRFSSSNSGSIRVCSDCNTTTTPLWRSGPRGPKSLCNACGIRQRKARRAMEEAAAVAAATGVPSLTADPTSTVRLKGHNNKEKKLRPSHVAQIACKKESKQLVAEADSPGGGGGSADRKRLLFGDFALGLSKGSAFLGAFPQDEAEAAILLMELSCGFVHG